MDSFDVLLSHNSRDKPGVRELFAALEERGLRPWLDEEHLIPGRRWQEALEEILSEIPAAAVLVGRDGLGPWEDLEMRAILYEFPRRKLPVIPVLLPGAPQQPELPLFLRIYTWVDLRDGITEKGIDRLVWGITGQKPQRPAPPPPEPVARPAAPAENGEGPVLGIDLGTTRSSAAVITAAGVQVISPAIPSVVAFTKSGRQVLVGATAQRRATGPSPAALFSVKRLLGRTHGEIGDQGLPRTPPEIAALLLGQIKEAAEAKLGEPVKRAVISVPACFDEAQRQAIRDAGRLAGFEVSGLVDETTAAALAHVQENREPRTLAVYHLGAGSFDISILAVEEDGIKVLATRGDSRLGGDDFDRRIVGWLVEEFRQAQRGIDLSRDTWTLQRLREGAEKAKIELSQLQETEISLPFLTADASGPRHLSQRLTRSRLEQLVDDLIQRSLGACRAALRDASLDSSGVGEVLLVGGQTRMPALRDAVRGLFGREPVPETREELVAVGAALQGVGAPGPW